jgi:translation initiation factor 2 subunit 3
MHVARSFDINRPGTRPAKLRGGVIGGSIVEGSFNVGDEIIIGPGRKIEKGNKVHYEPIVSKISSMQGGGLTLENMHSGGLCGMATPLDPTATTADNLSGQVVARIGDLPEVRNSVNISINLMEKMVAGEGEEASPIMPLRPGEMLMVNVATATSVGVVSSTGKGKATLNLRLPICADDDQRISLSRRVGARWRLIGHGTIE